MRGLTKGILNESPQVGPYYYFSTTTHYSKFLFLRNCSSSIVGELAMAGCYSSFSSFSFFCPSSFFLCFQTFAVVCLYVCLYVCLFVCMFVLVIGRFSLCYFLSSSLFCSFSAQRDVSVCATATAGAHWVITAGTACASWAGAEQGVTPPWKRPVATARTTTEVRSPP